MKCIGETVSLRTREVVRGTFAFQPQWLYDFCFSVNFLSRSILQNESTTCYLKVFTSLDDKPTQVPPPQHMLHSAVMSYLNRCPSHHTSFSEGKLSRFIHFRNTAEDLHSNRKTKKLFLSSFCSGFWEKHPTLLNFLWIKLIIIFFWGFSQLDSSDVFSFVGDSALNARAGILVCPWTDTQGLQELDIEWIQRVLWLLPCW